MIDNDLHMELEAALPDVYKILGKLESRLEKEHDRLATERPDLLAPKLAAKSLLRCVSEALRGVNGALDYLHEMEKQELLNDAIG